MSVALYGFDKNKEIKLCLPISLEKFYITYLEKAINELNIKFIKDGSNFGKDDLYFVLYELDNLFIWCLKNLVDNNLSYMLERLVYLKSIIPKALNFYYDRLYIF